MKAASSSVESEIHRGGSDPVEPAPAPSRAALRPPRGPANGRLPFWLVMLGLALVLGAFSRGENGDGGTRRIDPLAFDLDVLPATGSGAYTTSRPSNRTFALTRAVGGRFYALYGPSGPDGADAATALAGVLVGDQPAGGVAAGRAGAASVHEFNLESGALRVTRQEGPFDPARFVAGGPGAHGASAAPARAVAVQPSNGRYEGRLADAAGNVPATVKVGADGSLAIVDDDGCSLRGTLRPAAAAASSAAWVAEAAYGAGCTHEGGVLHGHAFAVVSAGGDALFVVLPDADLNDGVVFAGVRR